MRAGESGATGLIETVFKDGGSQESLQITKSNEQEGFEAQKISGAFRQRNVLVFT